MGALRSTVLSLLSLLSAGAMLLGSRAEAQTFSNFTPISIPSTGVNVITANPYPTQITVAGVVGPVTGVSVRLFGFSHQYPADAAILLVGPSGQQVQLMRSAGSGNSVFGVDLVFASDGPGPVPTPIVSGTYLPTVLGATSLPAPAPAAPYSSSLSSIHGTAVNGVWSLYVADTFGGADGGGIASGWSITFNPSPAVQPATNSFTYQGRLESGGVPYSGPANVSFGIWNHPTSTNSQNFVSGPVSGVGVNVVDGLFSAPVSFGPELSAAAAQGMYVEVSVATPLNPGPTVLSPRQQITRTPLAGRAALADQAAGLVPGTRLIGRQTIVGQRGPSNDSPGLWFSSIGNSGTVESRAFVGMRDDIRAGLFVSGGWRIIADELGRVGIGTDAPQDRLHLAGTAGTDAIRFPDGTRQTTAFAPVRFTLSTTAPIVLAADATHTIEIGSPTAFPAGSPVIVNPQGNLPAGLVVAYSLVPSANTIRVVIQNTAGAARTLPASSFNCTVIP